MKKYKILVFVEDGLTLEVRFDTEQETVWLTQAEMAELFDVDRSCITRHLNNIAKNDEVSLKSNVRKTHFTILCGIAGPNLPTASSKMMMTLS